MTLTPAYGRDYKTIAEVKAAFAADKDFVIADVFGGNAGRYVNRPQLLGQTVTIRYAKLRKVVVVKA
jgi:hypothetical protein